MSIGSVHKDLGLKWPNMIFFSNWFHVKISEPSALWQLHCLLNTEQLTARCSEYPIEFQWNWLEVSLFSAEGLRPTGNVVSTAYQIG